MPRRTTTPTSDPQIDFGFRTPRRPRPKKRGRPKKERAGVPHLRRAFGPRFPLHVTLRVRPHVWQLRSRRCFNIIEQAFFKAAARLDARIAQFSVQHNHIHLVVEADDAAALARAMQGLCIRVAKRLNKLMDRRHGAVFADRYHSRPLRTPTEVRRALIYVLCNGRKHLPQVGHRLPSGWIDLEYSSGAWFRGWSHPPPAQYGPAPITPPTTWLLMSGWRDKGGGPIGPDAIPS
jgi:REP element-mobilizing transposase RayT